MWSNHSSTHRMEHAVHHQGPGRQRARLRASLWGARTLPRVLTCAFMWGAGTVGGGRAGDLHKPTDPPAEDQVEQPQRHAGDQPAVTPSPPCRRSPACRHLRHPTPPPTPSPLPTPRLEPIGQRSGQPAGVCERSQRLRGRCRGSVPTGTIKKCAIPPAPAQRPCHGRSP